MMQVDIHSAIIACYENQALGPQIPGNVTTSYNNISGNVSVSGLGVVDEAQAKCDALVAQAMGTGSNDEDQYTRELITYYLMGIGGMTMCCLGLIGNMISLVVLTHKSMRSSTYSYLSALAVCDSLVLLFTILLLMKDVNKPSLAQQRWPWDEGVYPYLFPYVHPAAYTFQVTSIWLTLSFTVDRYIMICHPFKAEHLCSVSKARKVIMSLFITSIVFNIPKFFEYKTVAIRLPHNNTKIGCDLTWLGRSNIFRELYHSWFYVVFVCGVPFVALAVLNSFLMHAVRLSRKKGREINAAERKRNDTTIMLIGVVVTFFFCQMPALVSRMMWAFEDNSADVFKTLPLYTLNEIASFLIVLNSAINIVPYYFFGARFRRQLWRLFCTCLLRYDRFKKFTRNFSLTGVDDDQRRPSAISFGKRHSLATTNLSTPRSLSGRDKEMVTLSTVNGISSGGTSQICGVSSTLNYDDETSSPIKSLEVNGNYPADDDPALLRLLTPPT